MGDHRDISADSRYHMGDATGGFVPESDVVGRAMAVVWPFSHWRTLPIPDTTPPTASSSAAAQSLRQVSSAAVLWPVPMELPLVMGVAATVPRLRDRRRWRRRRPWKAAPRGSGI